MMLSLLTYGVHTKSVEDATNDASAKFQTTEDWRYANQYRARIVGWPEEIELVQLLRVQGGETRLNEFIELIKCGAMFIQIMTAAEFALYQTAGLGKGWCPHTKGKRADCHWKRPHVRRRLSRNVAAAPKTKEFIENSDDEIQPSEE